jgi:hypothetical protein
MNDAWSRQAKLSRSTRQVSLRKFQKIKLIRTIYQGQCWLGIPSSLITPPGFVGYRRFGAGVERLHNGRYQPSVLRWLGVIIVLLAHQKILYEQFQFIWFRRNCAGCA